MTREPVPQAHDQRADQFAGCAEIVERRQRTAPQCFNHLPGRNVEIGRRDSAQELCAHRVERHLEPHLGWL